MINHDKFQPLVRRLYARVRELGGPLKKTLQPTQQLWHVLVHYGAAEPFRL